MTAPAMTQAVFGALVARRFPHIRVSVLAVGNEHQLTIDGDRAHHEVAAVNEWAIAAGILPDRELRGFYAAALK